MSLNNKKNQSRKNTGETKDSINANSINSIQLRYFDTNISSKRYSNSSKKNNIYASREENEEIAKLNNVYLTKEREYNNLISQYKEIVDCLNQKKEFLNKNKLKYESIKRNKENMKWMLLKLMKIKSS